MSSRLLLKKLAGESFIYGISGVLSRSLSIFLVPIYTRVFSPADYGVIGIVTNLFALLSILAIFGLDNSVARWYYDSSDQKDQKTSINTYLWSYLLIAIVIALFVISTHNLIAHKIFNESNSAWPLFVVALNLPLTVFASFTWNLLRLQRRAVMTTVFTVTTSFLTIAASVFFVVTLKVGLIGIFYAQLIVSLISAGWTLILFRKQISLRYFNWQRWKAMFFFSLPLVPGSIAFWFVNLSGTYFVQLINNTHEVGLYQLGNTIASGVAMVTGAFQMAWGPFAYSIHQQQNAKQVYAYALQAYLIIACSLALAVTLFAKEILLIFATEQYVDAYFVAGLSSYNAIIIGLSYIASIGTGLAKNNKAYGISMLISAGLLVALNLILVPNLGKEGAALSTLISQSIVPLIIFWHAQTLYPIPYKFAKAASVFLISFLLGFGALLLLNQLPLITVTSIITKFGILVFYFSTIFLIFRNEVSGSKSVLKSPFNSNLQNIF